jgi:2-octaprenylphenol hydroxylase
LSITGDWDNRVYTVSPGSAAFLERCGAWQHLPRDRIARVETMRVYGDAGANLEFTAYDAGIRELAWIVEARALQQGLRMALRGQDMQEYCPANWTGLVIDSGAAALRLEDGTGLSAKLVVGADGAESRVRAAAGIAAATRDYGQLGVVANFSCERPHRAGAAGGAARRGSRVGELPRARRAQVARPRRRVSAQAPAREEAHGAAGCAGRGRCP